MSDESPPEHRWILERIDRNHAETTADIAKLENQLTAHVAKLLTQLDRYMLVAVYEADQRTREAREQARDERIKRLEERAEEERKQRETERATDRRMYKSAMVVALLSLATMVVGQVLVNVFVK